MMIHKITTSVDYNYWLKCLNIQLNYPTNQNSIKVPKVVEPTNKKTFGNYCNKQPNVQTPSLHENAQQCELFLVTSILEFFLTPW